MKRDAAPMSSFGAHREQKNRNSERNRLPRNLESAVSPRFSAAC
jgi:hypothetical protein